jgi:predicted XRE-type DNA-binding protein
LSDCVLSPYALDWSGYPHIERDGKNRHHHRYVYIQAYGDLPEDIEVRHTCDNRACINLEHLVPGTHQDNMDDMNARGRAKHPGTPGETHHNAILTQEDVLQIRDLYATGSYSQYMLADKFGVQQPQISRIVNGERWRK